jgi:hypothetical protein
MIVFESKKIRKVIFHICTCVWVPFAISTFACWLSGMCIETSITYRVSDFVLNTYSIGLSFVIILIVAMNWSRWKITRRDQFYIMYCWPILIWLTPWIIKKYELKRKIRIIEEAMTS